MGDVDGSRAIGLLGRKLEGARDDLGHGVKAGDGQLARCGGSGQVFAAGLGVRGNILCVGGSALIPVVGGLPSLAVSGVLILTMMRHGASGKVVRMALNVLLGALIGAIPIIGNIFDFAYKANDRNVRLLRTHYAEGKYQGSGRGLLALAVLLLLVVYWLLPDYWRGAAMS